MTAIRIGYVGVKREEDEAFMWVFMWVFLCVLSVTPMNFLCGLVVRNLCNVCCRICPLKQFSVDNVERDTSKPETSMMDIEKKKSMLFRL
mmetsp:Transcript_24924/g.58479  ORF Transcript_24924/g.58479 Transcript_24924/m.58479 type:complete len:90 (+) Transcript_24924:1124-1393(+)